MLRNADVERAIINGAVERLEVVAHDLVERRLFRAPACVGIGLLRYRPALASIVPHEHRTNSAVSCVSAWRPPSRKMAAATLVPLVHLGNRTALTVTLPVHAHPTGFVVGADRSIGPTRPRARSVPERRLHALTNLRARAKTGKALRGAGGHITDRTGFSGWRLRSKIAYAVRHHEELALCMFDLDHFKRVNDTFGHPAGDAALRFVGGIVQSRLRTQDVFARYGGEEFAVVFRGIHVHGAARAAERLRGAIGGTAPCTMAASSQLRSVPAARPFVAAPRHTTTS